MPKKATKKLEKPKVLGSKAVDRRTQLLLEGVELVRDYAIFALDPDGYILTWNQGAERLKGYKPSEIIGKHFSKFYSQADRDRRHPEAELKEAKKTGRYEEEGWRYRKDGTRFWANVVITKITDKSGTLLGFSKVTRDLSTKKEMEEKLRESEERFRLLIEGIKDYAIFMLDPQGYVKSWNEGAARINGYDAKEVVGKHFSIFYLEEDVSAGKCEYELKEAKLTGRFEDEGWRVRKDGSLLWANVVITAIRDRNKNLLGFAKITRDLTEKKRAEDKLQRAYAGLEKRIQDRTADLTAAKEALEAREAELQQAVHVRDEFLSIASHELKTPITSLKLQMQMLQERLKNPQALDAERLKKFLSTSIKQVNRLTHLVEDLLDVARAQAQKLEFQFERTDLASLAQEVLDRLKEQLDVAGCISHLEASGPVMGNFDRFRMDQVLVNLLTNAMKYAPGKCVTISVRSSGNLAILSVRDEGNGISKEMQARLFERFERGLNAKNIGGLGLGLFITRQIVEGHHGKIRVESEEGQGAEFVLELPLNLFSVPGKRSYE